MHSGEAECKTDAGIGSGLIEPGGLKVRLYL